MALHVGIQLINFFSQIPQDVQLCSQVPGYAHVCLMFLANEQTSESDNKSFGKIH